MVAVNEPVVRTKSEHRTAGVRQSRSCGNAMLHRQLRVTRLLWRLPDKLFKVPWESYQEMILGRPNAWRNSLPWSYV